MHRTPILLALLLQATTAAAQVRSEPDSASLQTRVDSLPALTIRADSVVPGTARTLPELLATRVPGLLVERSSGAVGAGSRIRLRGASGMYFSNQPLVVVDGVRYIGDERSITIDVGGATPSRLDDFDPEDVESIRVLPGPAAAAQYGAAGKNGVIEVRTRRGEGRPTTVRAYMATGIQVDPTSYPANYARVGVYPGGGRTIRCTLLEEANGRCIPKPDSLVSANPIEDLAFFRTGAMRTVGVSVGGSVPLATYYVSGSMDQDVGVLGPDRRERKGVRGSLAIRPLASAEVSVTASRRRIELDFPPEGEEFYSRFSDGLLASPFDPTREDGFPLSKQGFWQLDSSQDLWHTTLGIRGEWRPLPWIAAGASFGDDRVELDERQVARTDNPFWTTDETVDSEHLLRSLGVDATVSLAPLPNFAFTSTLGWERVSERLDARSELIREGLTPSRGRSSSKEVVEGVYLRQRLEWGDRVELNGMLRMDDPPGRSEMESRLSSSLGVAWIAVRDGMATAGIGEIRARAGYGSVPSQLRFLSKDARPSCPELMYCGGEELRTEVVRELEAGIDAELFGGRVGVGLTAYDQKTRDALAIGIASGVGGYTTALRNVGTVHNRGVEGILRADLVTGSRVSWSADFLTAVNRNRLEASGPPLGIGIGSFQNHLDGHPLGAYYGLPILGFEDLNGDGLIGLADCTGYQCEVRLGRAVEYLGAPTPTRTAALGTRIGLFGSVGLSARLDHQGGARLLNFTRALRCSDVCREAYERDTPLETQAAIAAMGLGTYAGFIEDADFVKLREVSVTLSAPATLARRVGAVGLDLTLAGRNLATWTGYTGFDPEVNTYGQAPFRRADSFVQPLTRQWTTRLDVRF